MFVLLSMYFSWWFQIWSYKVHNFNICYQICYIFDLSSALAYCAGNIIHAQLYCFMNNCLKQIKTILQNAPLLKDLQNDQACSRNTAESKSSK